MSLGTLPRILAGLGIAVAFLVPPSAAEAGPHLYSACSQPGLITKCFGGMCICSATNNPPGYPGPRYKWVLLPR